MKFRSLSDKDNSWAAMKKEWQAQCERFGEDFSEYAVGAFAALDPLAAEGHPRCGIFGFQRDDDGPIDAICQVNCTPLPGYDGPVLRVRFITYAPNYDFGDTKIDDYAFVLTAIFLMALGLSDGKIEPGMVCAVRQIGISSQYFKRPLLQYLASSLLQLLALGFM